MGLSRLIYGTLSLEGLERNAAARLVHAAVDHGLVALDTAPLYGVGQVEEHIGHALSEHRQRPLLLGKCGITWQGDQGEVLFESSVAGARRVFRKNGHPASIREEVHQSLGRLRVDHIDVMQLHQYDASVPIEDTLGALETLKTEGKIGAIGVSNFPVSALKAAADHLRRSARLGYIQDEYNALVRTAEAASLAFAHSEGSRFLAYSPLAQGLLAGRYLDGAAPSDHRKDSPRFAPDYLRRLSRVLTSSCREIAARAGMTLGQLSLHWVLSRGGVSAAIVGGRTEAQIVENAATLEKQVDAAHIAAFDQVLSNAGVVGGAGVKARLEAKVRGVLAKLKR